MQGFIHSEDSFSTLDGPGIRYVVFMSGCPLRCIFCHNPDTWELQRGKIVDAQELTDRILAHRNFYSNGGVTISGGEPLLQHDFILEFTGKLKAAEMHVALDTAGSLPIDVTSDIIDSVDMLLLDIKAPTAKKYAEITGQNTFDNTLKTLEYCASHNKEVWIRHVIVPGYTDSVESVIKLNKLISRPEYRNAVKKVELLPFHKMGEYKWKELGLDYKLFDTEVPTDETMRILRDLV
ncbi:MAG: pyruvate formate-lyase-activating protein [Clostridia bacterium]|nr:pyruvate formate-lyase-activating protein [Clostridia bacterium]